MAADPEEARRAALRGMETGQLIAGLARSSAFRRKWKPTLVSEELQRRAEASDAARADIEQRRHQEQLDVARKGRRDGWAFAIIGWALAAAQLLWGLVQGGATG